MKKIVENLIELQAQFDKVNTTMVQIKKDLNKKLNLILSELGSKAIEEVEDNEGSEEYPFGWHTTEPYDIGRDKDLIE